MAPALFQSKKRSRDAAEPAAASASSANGSSSSDSDSGSDSEDDEVENAMFRPAPKQKAEEDTESEADESEPEQAEQDAESEEEEEVPVKKQKKMENQKERKEEQPQEDEELKEEIGRKTEATVYVEGIPYRASEGDLVTHFSSCGTVREVRMPRYQDSGKPRGYAHVVFDDEAALKKALKLDGKYLFNRYLSIRRAEAPRAVELALKNQNTTKKAVKGCRTVFIKQLPYEVEEDTIREALASCGTITSVRLPIWNHTKKLKGFGYVEFSSEDEALAAARRSGMKIGDRMVLISLDAAGSAPKASFRQRDGQYWSKGEEAKKSLAKKISEKQQRQTANKKRKTSK
ncbi:unnamed protein product [Phytophthora lilii]|uniref:Unnamed protein product n=1 Tax=Phytophthora lilii TaxID=2077276 RepID=A0A9W6TSK1_9STRA|nr:unnamed protein product [Phytophthora lilii]